MKKFKQKIKVAIDSPAAAGAGTIAKAISKHFNLLYLDTGKIYRYIALLKLKNKKNFTYKFLKIKIKNLKLEDLNKKILSNDEIGIMASDLAKNLTIRKMVHSFQIKCAYYFPKKYNGSCLDGRDITYKIIPDAEFKFFVTANTKVRALRRFKELKRKNRKITIKEVKKDLRKRDYSDTTRKHSPLILAKDHVVIRSDILNKPNMVKKMSKKVEEKLVKKYGVRNKSRNKR